MKALKIILALTVVGIIGFFIWYWSVSINKVTATPPGPNPFTERIENQIGKLKKMPTDVYCHEFYKNIQDGINEFYNGGHFGNNTKDNKQWKEILSKNLYSAYAPKFVDQAMYVFNGTEWKNVDLDTIRSIVSILKSSSYLKNGPVANSFSSIIDILAKYDEITVFIASCNNFYFSNYDISAQFPDLSNQILKSKAYLSNNLDNTYVNNCARLKVALEAIPKTLFSKHVEYLRKKIDDNGVKYCEYNRQLQFSNCIYTPLTNQLKALKNDIYKIADGYFSSEYDILDNKLSAHNTIAFYDFSKSNRVRCNPTLNCK